MTDTTDQQQAVETGGHGAPPVVPRTARSAWNWFGAGFGAVVLVGASVVYVAGRDETSSGSDDTLAADTPVSTLEPPADRAGDDATEPHEAASAPGEEPAAPVPEATEDHTADGVEVVEIDMVEFAYDPSTLDVAAGVPVVFRLTNAGKLPHEAMVGDAHMQEEFAAADDHEGDDAGDDHHGDLMAVTVQPGETKDLEVVIDAAGTWYMACHLVGHYEAGQVATINVTS